MSHRWRSWVQFGAGALFGLLAGAVLYAPPEVGNQPPPWETWARGGVDFAPQAAGAGPVQPAALAVALPAPAALEPIAAASAPALAPAIEPAALVATAPPVVVDPAPPVKHTVKKRKVESEVPAVDTSALGAGPAPELVRIEPEAPRVDYAPSRNEVDSTDPSR